MKRYIKTSFIISAIALLLSGCSNNPEQPTTLDPTTQPTTEPTTQPTSGKTSSTSVSPTDYYASIDDSMMGDTLKNALNKIIDNDKVSRSYDWSRFEYEDADPSNSNNVILFYSRASDGKKNHVSGEKGWNREHSFPQSKMESEAAKKDNHVIFASDNKVNGTRGNYRIGNLDSYSPNVKDYNGKLTKCKKYSKSGEIFFDPGETPARGEVARATFYAAVMYNYDIKDNFESIELCLEWNLKYAVAYRDTFRNDRVYTYQKNRNPFVDHPEYACRIWGSTNSQTRQVCGM